MKIRFVLLTAIAGLFGASIASASDAVVIPEAEPVDYVRICDLYGQGFFYLPGTETCLKIGGYYRYEVASTGDDFDGYFNYARFAPTFSVKSETELGTLTGYVEAEMDWYADGGTSSRLLYSYVELNGFLVGLTKTPYARFLDSAGPTLFEGRYAYNQGGEISYTYDNNNGFTAIVAAIDNEASSDWETNAEAGARYKRDDFTLGAVAGYDGVADSWGARATVRFKVPHTQINIGLHGFYSSPDGETGDYTILDPVYERTEWSGLIGVSAELTPKVALSGTAQYFDTDAWEFSGDLELTPVRGLAVTPEVVYNTASQDWSGVLRFEHKF
ncbi:porin [Tianweitania populi]|uniref:porin n=1 Tax=Tianweitania populi TaxID=1607949 RepID=UPI001678DA52|nr:porin [Tianweitania populi]